MYELINLQQGMYRVEKRGIGQAAMLCASIVIPRFVYEADLQRAANEVFRINDGLRTRLVERDGKVYQEFKPFMERRFDVLRFESRAEMDAWAKTYATIPLKLDIRTEGRPAPKPETRKSDTSAEVVRNVLKRRAVVALTKARMGIRDKPACCELKLVQLPDACGAIIKMHHVMSDAWAMLLMANQFAHILGGETPVAYRYEEFIKNEEAYHATKRCERDRQFFAEQDARCPEPTWIWPQPFTDLAATRRTLTLDEDLTSGIKEYAAAHRMSPYVLFLTALAVFARGKTGRDAFFVGTLVHNRTGIKERNIVGAFATVIPLLLELDATASFAQTTVALQAANFSAFRHQKGATLNSLGRLQYDLAVSYQDATLEADATMSCTQYYCDYVGAIKVLTIEDRAHEGKFKVHFDHNLQVVPASDVDELLGTMDRVLREGIANDAKTIGELGA